MKHLIILFVLIATIIFAQVEQRPDRMEQLLWWDLYTTATANGGQGTIVVSDSIADDNITITPGDTVYAKLFITGTYPIKAFDIVLQYGSYLNYRPNSYYSASLTLQTVAIDSTALDMITSPTGLVQQVKNPTTKRLMYYYLNSGTIDLNNKPVMTLTFIAAATGTGQQILALPLSEDVSPHGYTLRYWTEIFNAQSKVFSTWVHNAIIKVE